MSAGFVGGAVRSRVACVAALSGLAAAAALLAAAAPPGEGVDRWASISPGAGFVNALAVAPGPAGAAYAATADAGVFRSGDRGASWAAASGGLGDLRVADLRVDPADPLTLYAATAMALYKTTDGGASWRAVLAGNVGKVAVAASAPRFVYAEMMQDGRVPRLFRSRDGGATWREFDAGLPGSADGPFGLEVDPRRPFVAYNLFADAVYGTASGGQRWSYVTGSPFLLATIDALAIDPLHPDTLLAGSLQVQRSDDRGVTWVPSTSGIAIPWGEVTSLAFQPTDPSVVYAGTGWGPAYFPMPGKGQIYKSVDGGASWSPRLGGLGRVNALLVDPATPRRVLAATDRGVLRTDNGGRAWADSNRGLAASQVVGITPDPSAPGTLFATLRANDQFLGVYRSDDGGANWAPRLRGLASATAPTTWVDAGRVVAVAGAPLYAAGSGQLDRSVDGGATWQPLDTGNNRVLDAAVDPGAPATVFAVGKLLFPCDLPIGPCPTVGLASVSRDGGNTFTDVTPLINPGPLPGVPAPGLLAAVAIAPGSGAVYVTGDLTARSDDHGATWTRLPLGPGIRSLALDPGAPSTLYAVDAATVWKSGDGGAEWTAVNAGLPAGGSLEMRRIAVDPSGSGSVALATSRGVFLLPAHQAAWTPLPGLEDFSVLSVAFDPFDPAKIYAGTAGGGGLFVYRRR
jgi:photosystem II stability/assembly factor-like uncharacterized protein